MTLCLPTHKSQSVQLFSNLFILTIDQIKVSAWFGLGIYGRRRGKKGCAIWGDINSCNSSIYAPIYNHFINLVFSHFGLFSWKLKMPVFSQYCLMSDGWWLIICYAGVCLELHHLQTRQLEHDVVNFWRFKFLWKN